MQQFYTWELEDKNLSNDLALFDSLYTCTAQNFDVELDVLVTSGFGGDNAQ